MKLKLTWLMTLFMALVMQFSYAQEKTVTGTVISEADGLPLPGVNVIVKGTTRGVQTDFDGNYTITASTGETLVFSFVSMKTVEMKVGSSSSINVSMQEDVAALEEVVVVGYSSRDETKVSGAVSVVKAEAIEQVPIASFDQILQGQAPGVQVSAGSGQPGRSARVRIRGNGSINGSNTPLYIVDGIQVGAGDFAALNPNDFENISVLKDASATAQYGSRGANGVIVVTTKKGAFGEKTEFKYRTQYGISKVGNSRFSMMNSQELLNFQRLIGSGLGADKTDAEIAELAQVDTNWEDYFFRTAQTVSHEISMTGGSEKSRYYSSLSYFDQEGISVRSDFKRFTFRNNFESRPNDKTKIGFNSLVAYSIDHGVDSEASVTLQNPYAAVYLASPYDAPYNADGTFATGNGRVGANALENLYDNGREGKQIRFTGSVYAERELFKNISARTDLGVDFTQDNAFRYADPSTHYGSTTTPGNAGFYTESNNYFANITSTTRLVYDNVFADKHSLTAGVYMEYVKTHSRSSGFTGYGINPTLPGVPAGISEGTPDNELIPTVSGSVLERGLFSYFGLVNYDFDGRFGIDASIRRDASSKFADENKWATFYSVAGRWNISNEEFLAGNKTINNLKLRASYGTSGNQDAVADYSESTAYGQTSYNGNTGIAFGRIGNPELKWEVSNQFNVGLDYDLFNYRLSGSVEYYNNKTTDLFVTYNLSQASAGVGSIQANAGSMRNAGFDVSLTGVLVRTDDFQFELNGNFNYNENEILDLGQVNEFEQGTSIIREGLPLGSHYIVGWAGVNPANGQPLYYDLDGNVTNVYSETNSVAKYGSFNPVWTGGFGARVTYKAFELSTLFTFAADYYRFNNQTFFQENPNFAQYNLSTAMLDMWQQPGDITEIQSSDFNREFSSKDIEDASFTKWRNLTIAYNLPQRYIDSIGYISGLRLYAQGQNLYTWTEFTGFDPEDDNNIAQYEYPTPRTFTIGLDVKF
ncbi:TonB-dependent receptor [Mangrovimonas sp. YM274]|uniref:SusC/RagA family TonB-linked outer membrane protein n=1 Tax=Mangrovimonas sp. YM274 TaxID=3070660 RepID=UPI0027DE678A|nr:TonB-dependent receptor [Mangrovimonas sp. YM274]WMI69637.1 TonB-dependent receptor [Mangrovimonas sp. YM274]